MKKQRKAAHEDQKTDSESDDCESFDLVRLGWDVR
jgi:hypothetical protein